MTIEQFNKLKSNLEEEGFVKYYGLGMTITHSDYYYAQSISDSYQILFHIFDYRKYGEPYYEEGDPIGVMCEVLVNRPHEDTTKAMVFTFDKDMDIKQVRVCARAFYDMISVCFPLTEVREES